MSLKDVMEKLKNEGINVKINSIIKEEKIIPVLEPVVIPIVKSRKGNKKKLIPGLVGGDLSNIYRWVCENPSITVEDCIKKCNELRYKFRIQTIKDYWRFAQSILKILKDLDKLK